MSRLKLFDINFIEGTDASTAAVMFPSVDSQLTNHGITWDYCLVIGLENTNAKFGYYNSIKPRLREKNESMIITGCLCHVLHNASCEVGTLFAQLSGFDIEEFLSLV